MSKIKQYFISIGGASNAQRFHTIEEALLAHRTKHVVVTEILVLGEEVLAWRGDGLIALTAFVKEQLHRIRLQAEALKFRLAHLAG